MNIQQDWNTVVFNKTNKQEKTNKNNNSVTNINDDIEIIPKISLSNRLLIEKGRANKKFTQQQVAKLLNVDINLYKKYENGQISPDYNILLKIEKVLNIKLNKKKKQ